MSCQATDEDIESETREREKETVKEKEETVNKNPNGSALPQQQTTQTELLSNYVPIRPAPPKEPVLFLITSQAGTSTIPPQTTKQSDIVVSPTSTVGRTPPPIYKTLKPPVVSGEPFLPQRVAVKSSPPSLPVQQTIPSLKLSTGPSPLVSPVESRYVA